MEHLAQWEWQQQDSLQGPLTMDTGGGPGQKEILIDILINSWTPLKHLWGLLEILGSDFTGGAKISHEQGLKARDRET